MGKIIYITPGQAFNLPDPAGLNGPRIVEMSDAYLRAAVRRGGDDYTRVTAKNELDRRGTFS